MQYVFAVASKKRMTVLYTTERYLAGHTAAREMMCPLERRQGEGQSVSCLRERVGDDGGRELESDVELRKNEAEQEEGGRCLKKGTVTPGDI